METNTDRTDAVVNALLNMWAGIVEQRVADFEATGAAQTPLEETMLGNCQQEFVADWAGEVLKRLPDGMRERGVEAGVIRHGQHLG